jgi:hypothetical protein
MHPLPVPCIAVAPVTFFMGSSCLYFHIRRPRIKGDLPFALLCFCIGICDRFSAGLCTAMSIDEGVLWQRLQPNSGAAAAFFLIWFAAVFIRGERNPFLRFSRLCFFIPLFAAVIAGPEFTLPAASPAVNHITSWLFWRARPSVSFPSGTIPWRRWGTIPSFPSAGNRFSSSCSPWRARCLTTS